MVKFSDNIFFCMGLDLNGQLLYFYIITIVN